MNMLVKAALVTGLIILGPLPAAAKGFPALFDTIGYRNESLEALPQWVRVMAEIEQEQAVYRGCADALAPCVPRSLLAWQAMLKGQAGSAPFDQILAVNRFANQWPQRADIVNHNQEDYWASPLTFLRRSGDCEDYAIMKYASLRQLGFEAERLRLVVVRDVLRDVVHAVLAVHVDDRVYILDNLSQAVLPQTMVRQYVPYYSVNENARWAHLPRDNVLLASTPWSVTPSADGDDPSTATLTDF